MRGGGGPLPRPAPPNAPKKRRNPGPQGPRFLSALGAGPPPPSPGPPFRFRPPPPPNPPPRFPEKKSAKMRPGPVTGGGIPTKKEKTETRPPPRLGPGEKFFFRSPPQSSRKGSVPSPAHGGPTNKPGAGRCPPAPRRMAVGSRGRPSPPRPSSQNWFIPVGPPRPRGAPPAGQDRGRPKFQTRRPRGWAPPCFLGPTFFFPPPGATTAPKNVTKSERPGGFPLLNRAPFFPFPDERPGPPPRNVPPKQMGRVAFFEKAGPDSDSAGAGEKKPNAESRRGIETGSPTGSP